MADATTNASAPTTSFFERIVPPASKPIPGWHISPFIDLAAYQFSWLWILIPLALSGDKHPKDYLGLFAVGMTLSLAHRYYTLPYVYLDKQVFSQHVTRFTLFFYLINLAAVTGAFFLKWKSTPNFFHPVDIALVVAGLSLIVQSVVSDKKGHKFSVLAVVAVAAPFTLGAVLGLAGVFTAYHQPVAAVVAAGCAVAAIVLAKEDRARIPLAIVPVVAGVAAIVLAAVDTPPLVKDVVKGAAIVGVVGAIGAAWNVWHTLMQKFGIIRVYAAKSAVPVEKRTPPWVDRFLIFGSFPLLAVVVGPAQREVIASQSKSVTQYLMPIVDGVAVIQPYAIVPAALIAAASIGCFIRYEYRADGLKSWPRLSMALALTLLNASFLVVSPLKVYIAYGFSHALEYMVFVWAFLRRRYATPLPHNPPLQRVLRRPVLAYTLFTAAIGITYFVVEYGKDYGLYEHGIRIFDVGVGTWLFSFAIWQSLAHFYFDGFLWKMRLPAVRASL